MDGHTFKKASMIYRTGDPVEILPEFRDPGDEEFDWVVVGNEDKGRVDISPLNHPLTLKPVYTVATHQLRTRCVGSGDSN